MAVARSGLAVLDVGGVEHLMDPATPDRLAAGRAEASGLFLLPGFDEFVLGYRDRRRFSIREFADRIGPVTPACSGRPSSSTAGSSARGSGPAGGRNGT